MANEDWNKAGFFSGITEDYSNYHWFKGEKENPYTKDTFHPLAASFWEYERNFHFGYLDKADTQKSLTEAYNEWKRNLSMTIYPVNPQIHTEILQIGKSPLKLAKERLNSPSFLYFFQLHNPTSSKAKFTLRFLVHL